MYICDTVAPGTQRTGAREPASWIYALATGQRTSQQMNPASSKASYNEHEICRRPAVLLTAILVIVTTVADMPTRRTTPATQLTCRTSAWRGGGIARTYAAIVRTHVHSLACS